MSALVLTLAFFACLEEVSTDCYSDLSDRLPNIDQSLKRKNTEMEELTTLHSSRHIKRLHDVDNMLKSLFLDIIKVDNKTFFLSRAMTINHDVALSTCNSVGFHLAEIQTEEELDYVIKVIDKYSQIQNVWIGVNDQREKGIYVYTDSGRPAFTRFAPNEPSGQPMEKCVTMRRKYHWLMADSLCVTSDHEHLHFLCQVPKLSES